MARNTPPMEADPELEAMLSQPMNAPQPPAQASSIMPVARMGEKVIFYRRGRQSVALPEADALVRQFMHEPLMPVFLKSPPDGKDIIEEPCINGVFLRLKTSTFYEVPESFYLLLLNSGKTNPLPNRPQDMFQTPVVDPRVTAAIAVAEM